MCTYLSRQYTAQWIKKWENFCRHSKKHERKVVSVLRGIKHAIDRFSKITKECSFEIMWLCLYFHCLAFKEHQNFKLFLYFSYTWNWNLLHYISSLLFIIIFLLLHFISNIVNNIICMNNKKTRITIFLSAYKRTERT